MQHACEQLGVPPIAAACATGYAKNDTSAAAGICSGEWPEPEPRVSWIMASRPTNPPCAAPALSSPSPIDLCPQHALTTTTGTKRPAPARPALVAASPALA
jgi:hypothetical protein